MILSDLIARLQELEKRHGPNKDVSMVIRVSPWGRRPKFIIALDIFGVGKSGRPELKNKVVIYDTKEQRYSIPILGLGDPGDHPADPHQADDQ